MMMKLAARLKLVGRNKSNITILVLGILAVLIALWRMGYLEINASKLENNTPSGWLEYKSDTNKFTIKYPPDFQHKSDSLILGEVENSNSQDPFDVEYWYKGVLTDDGYNGGHIQLSIFPQTSKPNFLADLYNSNETLNLLGQQVKISKSTNGRVITVGPLKRNDKNFVFLFYRQNTSIGDDAFYKMLGSFKFIDS